MQRPDDIRTIIEFARSAKGLVEDRRNDGVDGRVDRLDPRDMGLDHFANADLLRGDPSGEFGRR